MLNTRFVGTMIYIVHKLRCMAQCTQFSKKLCATIPETPTAAAAVFRAFGA